MNTSAEFKGILDHRGNRIAPRDLGLYRTPEYKKREYPQSYSYSFGSTKQELSPWDFRALVSHARWLFTKLPLVRGAINEMAELSFPLTAQYSGAAEAWGETAIDWLHSWRKINNIAGPEFSGLHSDRMRLIGVKVDGDYGTVLVRAEDGRYPMLQNIRSHQIRDNEPNGIVTARKTKTGGDPYLGLQIHNGVILNKSGRAVAYRVFSDGDPLAQMAGRRTGPTSIPDDPEAYQDISAANMILTFRPDFPDQVRGISQLFSSETDLADVRQLRKYEMRAQRASAAIAIIEKNELGQLQDPLSAWKAGSASGQGSTTAPGPGLVQEEYEDGSIRYFRSANPANGLTTMEAKRPTADAARFEDKIVASAFYGLGWDPNFALALKSPGGAWARIMIQKVRRTIERNQDVEAKARLREDIFGLSVAVQLGLIPAPPDGRVWDLEYQPPAKVTADAGNEARIRFEGYKLGAVTLREIEAETGRHWKDVRKQREIEIGDLLTRAKRLSKAHGITLQGAMDLLEQRSPNPAPVELSQPEQAGPAAGGSTPAAAEGDPGEGGSNNAENLKEQADSYGILVRAGAVTPQVEDESHFRAAAGFPVMSADATSDWHKEKNVRRPVTLAQPGLVETAADDSGKGATPDEDPDKDKSTNG
jgi:hypothetical protein